MCLLVDQSPDSCIVVPRICARSRKVLILKGLLSIPLGRTTARVSPGMGPERDAGLAGLPDQIGSHVLHNRVVIYNFGSHLL